MLQGLKVPTEEFKGPSFKHTNLTVDESQLDREGLRHRCQKPGALWFVLLFRCYRCTGRSVVAKEAELPSLSEQQIVDCSRRYGNLGCNGGWYTSSWDYLKDAQGSESEDAYPYKGRQGYCRFDRSEVTAEVHGYVEVEKNNENALKEAVATVGPVAVAISVSGRFPRYTGGVYYNPDCHNDLWHLNHAVLVVGCGSEEGQDYWLVKNSWGESWGLEGYVKMARNKDNNCGIACKAAYPQE